MHTSGLVSLALLAASAAAAPARQHPMIHSKSPYNKDFKDPYDHKIDTVGEGLQPLPIVCTSNHSLLFWMLTSCRAMAMTVALICWVLATRAERGRTQIWFDLQLPIMAR